jgi:cysteine-rich repeat protein
MKSTPAFPLRLSLMGLMLLVHPASAQGPLAPVAGPQPMMKTLQEMEPRTHIAAAGYVISAPGSYYLTANLNGGGTQNGITVNASGVTIDLRGFSIENCQTGISAAAGVGTVTVANGTVKDCNATGVDLSAASLCRLEGVILTANAGDGASLGAGSLMTLCTASGNGGRGLVLGDNGTVFRCVVQNNVNGGITIGSNCQATENTLTGNGQAGLVTTGPNNRVEANSANSNNGRGFLINGTGNLVIRNNACGNTINDYQLAPGNNYGQILVAPGAGFASSNAWANFGCSGCQSAAECDDANPCTEDACVSNACMSTPIPGCGPCQTASECDDGDPCTEDICQAELCVHDPIPGCGAPICGNGVIEAGEACDDGNTNNGDGCSNTCQIEGGGGCFTDSQCNDNNPCTMDLCVAGACVFTANANGSPCNDGNACTTGDVCVDGACTGGTPVSCDDGLVCTIDTCDGMGGCVNTQIPNCNEGACTDGAVQACGSDVGVCQQGAQTCSGGTWGPCVGVVGPSAELCDGQDNDCDGMVDEGLNLGQACNTGYPGVCASGTLVCGGGGEVVCSPGVSPGSQNEVCDGIDNDCDGQVDEGLGTISCGVGVCMNTVGACVNGQEQSCSPGMPSVEICDGLDNDCDGMVDEENVCNAVCGDGVVAGGETCDDQNQTNGDGCSAACTVEAGYSCAGSPSVCTPVPPVCGNGLVEQGEICDDGDVTSGDGCSAACIVEAGYSCTGSPSTCFDINECLVNNGGCSPNATCTNTVGSYTCACNPGYVGDGITCSQVATCMDGIKNGTETGVDCGGGSCAPCANGQGCNAASDCQSGICSGGQCVSN